MDFGAFVRMELSAGGTRDGLVHKSQLAPHRWENMEDVVSVGQRVWVKVIEIQEEGERVKLGLSMAVVSQVDGTDNDRDNVELELSQRRGGGKGKGQALPNIDDPMYAMRKAKAAIEGYEMLVDDSDPPLGESSAGGPPAGILRGVVLPALPRRERQPG